MIRPRIEDNVPLLYLQVHNKSEQWVTFFRQFGNDIYLIENLYVETKLKSILVHFLYAVHVAR